MIASEGPTDEVRHPLRSPFSDARLAGRASPMVTLNLAVAGAMVHGAASGLRTGWNPSPRALAAVPRLWHYVNERREVLENGGRARWELALGASPAAYGMVWSGR